MSYKDYMTIYLFNNEVYYTLEELEEGIAEKVYEIYPEIIHSDFDAYDSYEYESLFQEVEEIELSIEKLKENM